MPFPLAFLPFIKTIGGNQAASVLERFAGRIPAGQRFRPRIDVRAANTFNFRPVTTAPTVTIGVSVVTIGAVVTAPFWKTYF